MRRAWYRRWGPSPPSLALLTLGLLAYSTVGFAQIEYKARKEYRSLNTESYAIALQKKGPVDVLSSSGRPIFVNVQPLVWFEGDSEPTRLKVRGPYSQRYAVDDALGEGQGMRVRYKNVDWAIQAYPTRPFLTVQVAFINDGKRPVSVRELIPWSVGGTEKGILTLGPGSESALILENAAADDPRIVTERAVSRTMVGVFNGETGSSLVAGFLTQTRGVGEIRVGRSARAEEDNFDLFQAACVYDPPVVVEAGERLDSEVFYLALTEPEALRGLERYARAVAVANGGDDSDEVRLHGVSISSPEVSEARVLSAARFLEGGPKRWGWSHVSIGAGWRDAGGGWAPDAARFPGGFRKLTDEIHALGLTAGLSFQPFTARMDSTVVLDHPDWFSDAKPGSALGPGTGILDVTVPRARDWLRALAGRVRTEWGFDAITEENSAALLDADSYSDPDLTKVEVVSVARGVLREALGADFPIESMGFTVAKGVPFMGPLGLDAGDELDPGFAEVAARHFLVPHLFVPISAPLAATADFRARLTAWAMSGATLRLDGSNLMFQEEQHARLARVLPVPARPAKPMDLFLNESPRVWAYPVLDTREPQTVVAVFNWEGPESQRTTLPLAALGLAPGRFYTVYDFWEGEYAGTARDSLDVVVPLGGVRVLGFRPLQDVPMLLSTGRHFTQGILNPLLGRAGEDEGRWDPESRELSASFESTGGTIETVDILVPKDYRMQDTSANVRSIETSQEGRVLRLSIPREEAGRVDWSVRF